MNGDSLGVTRVRGLAVLAHNVRVAVERGHAGDTLNALDELERAVGDIRSVAAADLLDEPGDFRAVVDRSRAVNVTPGGRDRRLLANRQPSDGDHFRADIERVRLAVLRQLGNGTDVGEFLIAALAAAQACVEPGSSLTDNRPGSWEAALLESMLEQGGC